MPVSRQVVTDKLAALQAQYAHAGDFCFFVDTDNLPGIFAAGRLLCRNRAVQAGMVRVDCASTTILAQTPAWVRDYVRLYFAPLTPMLYQVEGIKRRKNDYPECPRPVYMVFHPVVLTLPGVKVSTGNMGSQYTTCQDASDQFFAALPFSSIYHRGGLGWNVFRQWEIKRCRHAEVLIPSELSLEFLRMLVFRSEAERDLGLGLIGAAVSVPVVVDSSWFNCVGRLYADKFPVSDTGRQFQIANVWANDCLTLVQPQGVGLTAQSCTFNGTAWSAWTAPNTTTLAFPVVADGKTRLYLNGYRVAEY